MCVLYYILNKKSNVGPLGIPFGPGLAGAFSTSARPSIPNASKAVCLLRPSFYSGRWESNPVYLLPKQTYYRYTTARSFTFYKPISSVILILAFFVEKSMKTAAISTCHSMSSSIFFSIKYV